MSITIAARKRSVTLAYDDGSSPLVVSAVFDEFTVSNDHENGSGLIKTTGVLKLKAFPKTPLSEPLNPLLNPARFARGSQVIVYEANSSGILTPHPRGRLRILKPPLAARLPNRPTLEIEVGCLLALQDWRQPPGEATQIDLGAATDRQTIINRLAAEAGLPSLVDTIPTWQIDYPLPRLSGSWVQQMGLVAHDAGYVLWIDNQERLRAQPLNLAPTTLDFNLVVGQDEQFYDYLPVEETPCERVRCYGVRPMVKTATDPEPETSIASDSEFSPAEISITSFSGMASATPTISRLVRRPRGRVFPDIYPGNPSLINALQEQSTSYYDDTPEGLLRRKFTLSREPKGVVFPDDNPGDPFLTISRKTYVDYVYANDVTQAIITRQFEPFKVVNPDLEGTGDALAFYQIEQYFKTNKGWRKTTSSRSFKPGGSASTSISFSGSGNNQPPAPERRQQEKWGEDKPLKAEVSLLSPAGSSFYRREREFEIATPVSEEHLEFLARLKGGLLWGRLNRVTWATFLRDRFFTHYQPLMTIDWTESVNGQLLVRSRYLTDGMSFSSVEDSTVVAGDTIRLGTVSIVGETTYLEPPYTEVNAFTGGFVLGGEFSAIDSSTSGIDFDWIVVSEEGDVVTSGGNVVATEGDFDEIVVSEEGDVVTSGGNVVATGDNANWDTILVGPEGAVVTSGGFVVTEET